MNSLLVVTGGTKGLGKSIIEIFANKEFDIVTCSRHIGDLEKLKSYLQLKYSQIKAHVFVADLSIKSEALAFSSFVRELGRPIDVLVNNTGTFYPGQVHNEEDGVLEKTIETNLYSAYYVTRGIVDGMIAAKRGYIFTICSTASITAYPRGASYCISKFALLGMTKVLREELKEFGIKVTAVIPGSTLTRTWDGVNLPEEVFMKPEDVASAVYSAYALSPNTVLEEMILRPQQGDV